MYFRQPKRMARVENKALNMLADLKDNKPEAAESLMKRLTPDVRRRLLPMLLNICLMKNWIEWRGIRFVMVLRSAKRKYAS